MRKLHHMVQNDLRWGISWNVSNFFLIHIIILNCIFYAFSLCSQKPNKSLTYYHVQQQIDYTPFSLQFKLVCMYRSIIISLKVLLSGCADNKNSVTFIVLVNDYNNHSDDEENWPSRITGMHDCGEVTALVQTLTGVSATSSKWFFFAFGGYKRLLRPINVFE